MGTNELPLPIKKQREVLYMPAVGHVGVLGTAGSGKTSLALYRAAYLSERSLPHSGNTLLVTFNNSLVSFLKSWKLDGLENIKIENYHTFARGFLKSRGKMTRNCICNFEERRKFLMCAATNVLNKHERERLSYTFFETLSKEIETYVGNGMNKNIYFNQGPFYCKNEELKIIYEIYEEYLKIRQSRGFLYDLDDIALAVYNEYQNENVDKLYKHIVIDEGQDFSPIMIRSLSSAIPKNGSITFFGDKAQQIYKENMDWRSSGLNIKDCWEFDTNYRNTRQIALFANEISKKSLDFFELELVQPKKSGADGALPMLYECKDVDHELEIAIELANSLSETQSVAILFKNRMQIEKFRSRLPSGMKRKPIVLSKNFKFLVEGSGIFYGTIHSAKGLEFDNVILPFLSSEEFPDQEYIRRFGRAAGVKQYCKLLYVGVTRAKNRLVLLYSGTKFTNLLPEKKELFDWRKL